MCQPNDQPKSNCYCRFFVGLITLLTFAAFGQIPSDTTLRIQLSAHSGTNVHATYIAGIVSNTQPDVRYEMQYRQNKTNWISLWFFDGSEITNCQPLGSWITNSFDRKAFRIRSWKSDGLGDGIPDWWEMKYFGNIGIDAYANPMGDGWNNIQKFRKDMDPFKWYLPPEPDGQATFQGGTIPQHENAILTWRFNGPIPDSFSIERAIPTLRGIYDKYSFPFYRRKPNGEVITNFPPARLNAIYNSPSWRQDTRLVTGPYQVIAQMATKENVREYHYVDTNISHIPPPVYRIRAYYPESIQFAKLRKSTTTTINNTVLSVAGKPQTNGYELTVLCPIVHARYLLLVRDKNDRQWRASGYFVSGTNRDSVRLHVDKQGMMTDVQSPISLPTVKFLPDVVQPEFMAGWGEDSDGDTMPDIYEVLVTHTEPNNPDTGDTGIYDGYRDFAGDGWNNWEKFHYRANPFQKYVPPPAIVLKTPTMLELMKAQMPKTDLPYYVQLEIRTNTTTSFQPYSLWLDSHYLTPDKSGHARCDVRISWKVPAPNP